MNIALDCETIGLNHHHPDFKVLFNGWLRGGIVYQDLRFNPQYYFPEIIVGHGIKFDLKCLYTQGYKSPSKIYDTQVAVHLLREDLNSYKLEELARIFYRYPNYKNLIDFDDPGYSEELDTLKLYNAHDLIFTKQLQQWSEPLLKKTGKWPLFQMMMDFVQTLSEVEMRGVKFDEDALDQQGTMLQIKESEVLLRLSHYAALDWGGSTTDEIRDYFSSRYKLPKSRKSKKTKLNENVLKELDCLEAKLLLELRGIQKQKNTYVEGIKKNLIDGFYYPEYRMLTSTGRLTEHYIQVMPRKETSDFKKCIVSRFPNGKLLECDWSQLEARLQAELLWELTGKHTFADDLMSGKDIHAETLARFPFLPDRTRAKNANFSVIFGGQGYSLVNEYGFTWEQARVFTKDLTETRYPEFGELFKLVQEKSNKGYIEHPYTHRGRHTNNYNELLNAPIQGLGTDFNKIIMIELNNVLETYDSKPVMECHDSIIIDVKTEEEKEVAERVREVYKLFANSFFAYFRKALKLKYDASFKIGSNLYDMKELDK